MKRATIVLVSILLAAAVASSPMFLAALEQSENEKVQQTSLNLDALSVRYGDDIPLVADFSRVITGKEAIFIESLGIQFSLGTADASHLGTEYLVRGSRAAYEALIETGLVQEFLTRTGGDMALPPRDISIPEVQADIAWQLRDTLGNNITGEDVLIADLDTGIDWKHPDFWYADGSAYDWLDDGDGIVENASDAVDLDGNTLATSNEALYYIDIDRDGTFNATTDWIWVDSIVQDAIPQVGEPFFVVDDSNQDDSLDTNEQVIMLSTSKVKSIIEKDGDPITPSVIHWDRDGLGNLTSSTHVDSDGHGTAVTGILCGGQLGYRKYVGVAPKAEIMMIKVFGANNERLDVLEGLLYAKDHGADVILIELGQWVEVFMDGSSTEEQWIDSFNAIGIPVIVPSGNLGGSDKHAKFDVTGGAFPSHLTDFNVPWMSSEIQMVWVTTLSVNDTDFMRGNFTVMVPTGGPVLLHPGYESAVMDTEPITGTVFHSYVSNSTRGTKMMHIEIFREGGLPTGIYTLNVTLNRNSTAHCYIADDNSGWSGGAVWMTAADVSNAFLITWPSTADEALSVASYHSRGLYGAVGSIASYSAIGPRIDGVLKQGIAAPGGWDVISDYTNESTWDSTWYAGPSSVLPLNPSFGGYRLFSGTSASGPHVAGCAALMLQGNPGIGAEVSTIIKETSATDAFTGAVPNSIWGSGKLNASAAVECAIAGPIIATPERDPTNPYDTDDVEIAVNVIDSDGVAAVLLYYYNGTYWSDIAMTWNGTHYVALIPALPGGTTVTYRIYANDTLGCERSSIEYSYVVQLSTTTTTTTSTTTTTTTSTTSTTTTTSTIPDQPDYMQIAVILGVILILVVLSVMISKRRS